MIYFFSPGVETFCDGRKDGTQCYAALGGTVVIRLVDDATDLQIEWRKNQTVRVLYVKDNKIVVNMLEGRSSFTPSNGTFRISKLSYNDSAVYPLDIFEDGSNIVKGKLTMSIQGKVLY